MTTKELKKQIIEIENICKEYSFLDKTVMPYGYPIKISTLIEQWKKLKDCYGLYNKDGFIYDEVKILKSIIESWKAFEDEPKIKIKLMAGDNKGEIKYIQKSIADCFVKGGLAIIL